MADVVRVLHVDDDRAFLDLTSELLPQTDGAIEIVTATSAEEGLDRLGEAAIDCVVSDYEMPGTDGIEFLEMVRERHDDLPFILFTGKGSEAVASDAISAGVTDYLQKKPGSDQYTLLANRIRNAVEATLAREQSRRRKREYRTLIESSPVPIIVIDENIDILYLNPSAAETIGTADTTSHVGMSALAFLHPEDKEGGIERVEEVFAASEPVEPREYRIVTAGGQTRHVQGNIVPVTFEGEPAAQLVFTDITEQKERERALKQERRRFSSLFENFSEATIAYADKGDEHVVRAVNDEFVETFGYDSEASVGRPVDDLLVPPEKTAEATELGEQVRAGEPLDTEVRRQTVDGQRWFTLRNVSTPGVDDVDGYAIYTDINERVRQEEQFKMLHDGTRQLLSADSTDDVAETVARVAKEILDYEYTAVRLADEAAGLLRPVAATEGVADVLGDHPDYSLDGPSPHAEVYGRNAPVVYDDVREATDGRDRGGIRSAMYLPIDGHGVVIISALEIGAFDLSDIEIASILTANAQAALDRLDHEREIQQVKERFQAFVEHASDAITLLDEDGIIKYLSPATEHIIGIEPEELVGEQIFGLVHPEDTERVCEVFRRMIESAETDSDPVTVELRVRHADGSWIWLEAVGGGKVADGDGGYVVTAREITERKRREQELERYETIVEIAGDGVYTLDTEGRFTFVNGSIEKFTGYGREELLGEHVSMMMTETDIDRGLSIINSLLTTDRTQETYETTLQTKDGSEIPCELSIALLPDDDGFSGTIGIGRVITDRKEREQQLERERKRFSALFENFPEPTVAYAFEGGTSVVRDANGPFEELFGYDADSIIGRPIEGLIVPEQRMDKAQQIGGRIRSGELVNAELRREAANGKRYFNFRNIPCPGGENVNGFAVYADVTERVEREQQLERQNERLDEFASVVSHDLRNPLNVARTRLELASAETDSEHLDHVEEAIVRIESILDDTLKLARHGQTVMDREQIDLQALAEESWGVVETDGASIDIEDSATLQGSRGRLRQVFENLFRNAVEHGTAGAETDAEESAGGDGARTPERADQRDADSVRISVGTISPDGIYVADDGPGIPEDDREEVFEPGNTAVEDGTGFGLTIVRDVVEAHGWEVTVTESEAGGARFEIAGIDTE